MTVASTHRRDGALDASYRLQQAADLIRHAAHLLENMERPFWRELQALDGADAISTDLALCLGRLARSIEERA
ncbi:hypothetical protein [Sphingomonas sp. Ag1]|uniref:hypothetical protein n=1 Tax=Sphingomonas sp. Ag1 TaxID=1642949 RepID=UPI0006227AEA|nr:hypothetical protein [Sphingomonas sp. Ag1]KKI17473.1 hypothetical protein XM50_14255 [Sphingomonas sp. Ag1]